MLLFGAVWMSIWLILFNNKLNILSDKIDLLLELEGIEDEDTGS